jgi:hypothetical protein
MSFQLVDINRYNSYGALFSASMKKCTKCNRKFHTNEGLNKHTENSH